MVRYMLQTAYGLRRRSVWDCDRLDDSQKLLTV